MIWPDRSTRSSWSAISAPTPKSGRPRTGGPIVNLRVATTETWRDKASGERRESTEWHRVVIFNENLRRVAEQYLKKGSKVYIEGQLQTRKWQDQSGQDRYSTEVVLQQYRGELTMLDGKQRDGAGAARATSATATFGRSGPFTARAARAARRRGQGELLRQGARRRDPVLALSPG